MDTTLLAKFFHFTLIISTTVFMAACGEKITSTAPESSEEYLPEAPPGKEWKLVWSDEFNGDSLDWSIWETPVGPRRDGYWVKEDSYLDGNGNLIIRTKKDGDRYTSGAIRTLGKFEQKFGYWVARCRFPTQEGHWPAFWLFCHPETDTPGYYGGYGPEIDIMEYAWPGEDRVQHALHWDDYGKNRSSAVKKFIMPGLSKEFHTFGLYWKPYEFIFNVDGKETWRIKEEGFSQVPAYVKLTEEIGKWAGDIKNAELPDYFYVDYVRVYDMVDKKE